MKRIRSRLRVADGAARKLGLVTVVSASYITTGTTLAVNPHHSITCEESPLLDNVGSKEPANHV